jgi:hypothetical protein
MPYFGRVNYFPTPFHFALRTAEFPIANLVLVRRKACDKLKSEYSYAPEIYTLIILSHIFHFW